MITKRFLFTFFAFVSIAFSQDINCWKDEKCRQLSYANDEWYFGFAEDVVKQNQNVAESRGNLEQNARSRMIESIKSNIHTQSQSNMGNTIVNNDEILMSSFARTTKTSANAEIINAFVDSYHDTKTNRIYAFAAVKKADLANFYAAQIEFALSEADRELELSAKLLEHSKIKETFEKLDKSKKMIDSTAYYRTLLVAVDTQNGIKRSQGERITQLLNHITIIQTKAKAKSQEITVFITGNEDIIVSELQAILSENDVAVTENESEAAYIFKIDANACNETSGSGFHFVYACVKGSLTNTKNGQNEIMLNLTGPKGSGMSAEKAQNDAFRKVVPDIWAKAKDKILGN